MPPPYFGAGRQRGWPARQWTPSACSAVPGLQNVSESETVGVALVLHQQAIDTTTAAGRMFFQVTGAFAEFERMICSRVKAGLERARREVCASDDQGLAPRWKPSYALGWRGVMK